MNSTVIIGAGLSGLLLAQHLQARGEPVTVLEKSRGLGGRMATKRVGEAVFDQGAQYFTARDPRFVALVEAWQQRGWVAPWPGGAHRRFIGTPSMTAVPKGLAEGLAIKREYKATSVRRVVDRWEIEIEEHGIMVTGRVILTAPAPQSLALLKAGDFAWPPEAAHLAAGLRALTYHPCLALLVSLNAPSAVPVEGVAFAQGPLRWIADNAKKGIAPQAQAALTLHASPEFAAEHYGKTEEEVAALLVPEAARWLGEGKVLSQTLHRWKFSEPAATFAEPCLWLPEVALGFAGDAFGGPKIEGAALSALALAERLG